jgi:hydrogenase-4 component B
MAMSGAMVLYCFTKYFGISFLAMPRTAEAQNAKEVPLSMLAGPGILSVLCALLGIFPAFSASIAGKASDVLATGTSYKTGGLADMITRPLAVPGSAISPLGVFLLILLISPLLYCTVNILKGKTAVRRYGTWDCGYIKLDSRMQYSATGFSKPMRIVLRGVFRPQRELKIEDGSPPYYIKAARYTVTTESLLEKYIYSPLIKGVFNVARRIRLLIQTGSIHTYLVYMLLAIVFMFLYYCKNP